MNVAFLCAGEQKSSLTPGCLDGICRISQGVPLLLITVLLDPALTRNPQGEVWEDLNGQLGVLLGGVRSIAYFATGCVTVHGVGALLTRESSSASRVLLGFLYVSIVDGSLAIRLKSTPSLCPWSWAAIMGSELSPVVTWLVFLV